MFDLRVLLFAVLSSVLATAVGCGGGGGGSSGGSDTANVSAAVSPDQVEIGNLAFLRVEYSGADFDDLESLGLTIKLLVPNELAFQNGSSTLTLSNGAHAIPPLAVTAAPTRVVRAALVEHGLIPDDNITPVGEFSYYVFPLTPSIIDEEEEGTLQMTFAVTGRPRHSVIFTDVDRDAISAFDPDNADFDDEGYTEFEVQLDSPEQENNG